MANVKVSSMSPLPAVNATYTYGITGSNTEGKVPINTATGLPVFDGNDLIPYADNAAGLGDPTLRWNALYIVGGSSVYFVSGANQDQIAYSAAVGPYFINSVAAKTMFFDFSAYSANRTVVFPDAGGIVALSANSQKFTPTTGQTVSPTNAGHPVMCFIDPAGTLAALTLTLPAGAYAGQVLYACFTQIITALTVTSSNIGTDGYASPSAATATSTFGWSWNASQSKWNRFQ